MIDFVKKPNLPEGRVTTIICGTDDERILSFFDKKGIEVLKISSNTDIDLSVSNHADMVALHFCKNVILLDKKQKELKQSLKKHGMTVLESLTEIKGVYPDDVKLNFAFIGKKVIGNFKYADIKLASLISDKDRINVKQGYCKCSILVVNENAVITDDESIHRKMLENDIDSLLIRKGDISLKGHEYGFIGGTSGKISENEVVFFGDIKKHRDYESIADFLSKNNCTYVCSDNGELRDIGGIIPIIEEI